MKFKAYIFQTPEGIKTSKTTLFGHFLAAESNSGVGYLIEGEQKKVFNGSLKQRFMGRINYRNPEEFYKAVQTEFKEAKDNLEEKVEMFSKKNGLESTRLIITN